jgi:hypothetical protein
MVAFPSGQMGGGLPPSGGAFGASAGKQSGVNWGSINQFLEGPFQDLTEGLASVITKDNAYRQYINEKRSARKRQRLHNALEPLELIAGMLAKEPRLAKVYGPGGAYDGSLQTQAAIARAALAENGLPPESADQYLSIIAGLMEPPVPPEQAPPPEGTALQQEVDFLEERLGRPLTEDELLQKAQLASKQATGAPAATQDEVVSNDGGSTTGGELSTGPANPYLAHSPDEPSVQQARGRTVGARAKGKMGAEEMADLPEADLGYDEDWTSRLQILGRSADGGYRVKDKKTGRTGTWYP